MKHFLQRTFFYLFLAAILFAVVVPASAAETQAATSVKDEQENTASPDTRPLAAISDMGEHLDNPANSLPAIRDAMLAGAEMIRIPLQKTKDGVFILSEFPNLSIACDTDDTPISEKNWADISSLTLRNGTGGSTTMTDLTIVDLDTALGMYGRRVVFLLDTDWENRDALYQKVLAQDLIDRCVFVCRTSAKKALTWRDSVDQNMKIMVYEKTNVIFTARAAVRAVSEADNAYLWLATSNPYGMIFQSSTTVGFADLDGVMIQCTDPNECGQRTDTPLYWEDLAARGYNLLMTDDIAGLKEYIKQSNQAREELRDALQEIKASWVLPDYPGFAFADYRFRYENALTAAEDAANRESSGFGQCRSALYDLRKSIEQINENDPAFRSGDAGVTITPGRIITVVIGIAAFVALELFIHKHRGKARGKT